MEFTEIEKQIGNMTSDEVSMLTLICIELLNKKFEEENDAKNQAYYFILSHGYFNEFIEFSKTYHSENQHKDCIKLLLKQRPKL